MAYSYTNSKGNTYYLHSRQAKNSDTVLYFFAREEKEGAVDKLPPDYKVKETGTGLPVLQKVVLQKVDSDSASAANRNVNDKDVTANLPPESDFIQRPGRVSRQGEYFYRGNIIAATRDMPTGDDRLGFANYVDAFVRLVDTTIPPLTVGVYGSWGSGKSFLLTKIIEKLDPKANHLSSNTSTLKEKILKLWRKEYQPTRTDTLIVWFGAWDYNATEKLWAGIVERIFLAIEQSALGQWYVRLRINLVRNFQQEWRRLKEQLLPFVLFAIVAASLTAIFFQTNQQTFARFVSGSTAIIFVLALLREFLKLFLTPASQRIVKMFSYPDYSAELGFMSRIRYDLQSFANSLPEGMKIVVFVDDLDRCDPQKAVEVLEAIKLLLDFERFIVFMALDARIITRAIEEKYSNVLQKAGISGYEYLDKIIQIPFNIPQPSSNDIRNYVGTLLEMAPEDIKEWFDKTEKNKENDNIKDYFQLSLFNSSEEEQEEATTVHSELAFSELEQIAFLKQSSVLSSNPRRVKRLVNLYRLIRYLIDSYYKRFDTWDIPATLLDTHKVLGWLILCDQWPYLCHLLLENIDARLAFAEQASVEATKVVLQTFLMSLVDESYKGISHKMDMPYSLFMQHLQSNLSNLTVEDIQLLRPFVVSFIPVLSTEVQQSITEK